MGLYPQNDPSVICPASIAKWGLKRNQSVWSSVERRGNTLRSAKDLFLKAPTGTVLYVPYLLNSS